MPKHNLNDAETTPESPLAAIHEAFLDLPSGLESFDFKSVPSHGGVYTLATDGGEPIITLSSQNIRQAIRHRLTTPDETRSPRAQLGHIARQLWWTPAYSTFEADWVYLSVMRHLRPNDYREMIRFGPVWFAQLDLKQKFPKWRVASVIEPTILNAGPFGRRSRVTEFIAELEHLFELCRDYDILRKTPIGQPCVYFEMGRCPAPCNGSISMQDYGEMMAASARFATGEVRSFTENATRQMNDASSSRDYATAARLRESIEKANALVNTTGRYGQTYESFRYIVVQRGPQRTKVVPFFVDRGVIERGEAVRIKDVGENVEPWFERARLGTTTSDISNQIRSEHIWLVTHFLMKQKAARGLFLKTTTLPTPDKFIDMVRKTFNPPKRTSDRKITHG